MFDPITTFHQKIGEPFGRWFKDRGFELMGIGIAWALALASCAVIIWTIVSIFV